VILLNQLLARSCPAGGPPDRAGGFLEWPGACRTKRAGRDRRLGYAA